MSDDELLRRCFAAVKVNDDFSEAVVTLADDSRLEFCHRVGKRTAKAVGPAAQEYDAGRILARIARFRLNGKHLDITFTDGSRWEILFDQRPKGTEPSR